MSKLFYHVILLFGQAMNSRSYIRRFNIPTSFVGDKKRVESMLKDNSTALSDAENMLFGSKYEELVVKSLSSQNRGSCSRREVEGSPFEKARYLEAGEIWGRIATAVGQTLQQQYPTGRQGRGKNEFINNTLHQLNGPSICIRI